MTRRTLSDRCLLPWLLLLGISGAARAQNAISVGDVVVDPPTICCLGFSVPIGSGDDNYNATATIEYRVSGSSMWLQGLPLLRVRPELTSVGLVPDELFLGHR